MDILSTLFDILAGLKALYDDIEGQKAQCHNILQRCMSFEGLLRQLAKMPSFQDTTTSNLHKLLLLMQDCADYCQKFTSKTYVRKVLTSMFKGFEFDSLNQRITQLCADLHLEGKTNLQVWFCIV